MTTEYNVQIRRASNPSDVWTETMDIPDGVDPAKYAQDIVKRFNDEEKARKKANPKYEAGLREFVSIVGTSGISYCKLEKRNLTTVHRRGEYYDIWQCSVCHISVQRSGLAGLPKLECKPTQTCVECNKVFKTEKELKKHEEKGKHKTPGWIGGV